MWKIVAVFLLLLALVGAAAFNKEGLSWMLVIFFAFLGVGILIYTFANLRKDKHLIGEMKEIKGAMGAPEFRKAMDELKDGVPAAKKPQEKALEVELPKASVTGAYEPPKQDELHVPNLEIPGMRIVDSSEVKDVPDTGTPQVNPVELKLKIRKAQEAELASAEGKDGDSDAK